MKMKNESLYSVASFEYRKKMESITLGLPRDVALGTNTQYNKI
jgi:hypothetical protein